MALSALDLFCAIGWNFGYGKPPKKEEVKDISEQDTEEFIPINPYLFVEDDG